MYKYASSITFIALAIIAGEAFAAGLGFDPFSKPSPTSATGSAPKQAASPSTVKPSAPAPQPSTPAPKGK